MPQRTRSSSDAAGSQPPEQPDQGAEAEAEAAARALASVEKDLHSTRVWIEKAEARKAVLEKDRADLLKIIASKRQRTE